LGRAQEFFLAIRTYHLFHKLKIPIYVDGLVRAVTDVFRNNLDLLPAAVQNLVKQNGIEPFFDPVGTPPIISIGSPKERPLAMAHPSVIVASSGMLTGGAIRELCNNSTRTRKCGYHHSGYTDEESPGRLLQNLQTGDKIDWMVKKLPLERKSDDLISRLMLTKLD
jgi:predicted metal-dependent RNase